MCVHGLIDLATHSRIIPSGTPEHALRLRSGGVSASWLLAITLRLDLWEWPTWEVASYLVKTVTEYRGRARFADLPEVRMNSPRCCSHETFTSLCRAIYAYFFKNGTNCLNFTLPRENDRIYTNVHPLVSVKIYVPLFRYGHIRVWPPSTCATAGAAAGAIWWLRASQARETTGSCSSTCSQSGSGRATMRTWTIGR